MASVIEFLILINFTTTVYLIYLVIDNTRSPYFKMIVYELSVDNLTTTGNILYGIGLILMSPSILGVGILVTFVKYFIRAIKFTLFKEKEKE
jgi:hypothetical protein